MTDLTLQEAIAEATTFCSEYRYEAGDALSAADALILNAVASGELIPLADHNLAVAQAMTGWKPIATAPKDGTRFWGKSGDAAIAMLWHGGFGEFVSSWRRMEMAPGYLINGKEYEDHSPVVYKPKFWMPMPDAPEVE